jgi:hypothetical protein
VIAFLNVGLIDADSVDPEQCGEIRVRHHLTEEGPQISSHGKQTPIEKYVVVANVLAPCVGESGIRFVRLIDSE